MINIKIIKKKLSDIPLGFEVSGHSGYAESGQDIVCAAVSSACYLTANGITDVLKVKADISVSDGYMKLQIKENFEKCRDFISSFELHAALLQQQFSDYIIVSYLEV